jgi:hypothetical protein
MTLILDTIVVSQKAPTNASTVYFMFIPLYIHGIIVRKDRSQIEKILLVVAEEDLDGQPRVAADLEALR